MSVERLEVLRVVKLLGFTLLYIVAVKDCEIDHIRVDNVVENGVTEDFKLLVAPLHVVRVFERPMRQRFYQQVFVSESVVENLFHRRGNSVYH